MLHSAIEIIRNLQEAALFFTVQSNTKLLYENCFMKTAIRIGCLLGFCFLLSLCRKGNLDSNLEIFDSGKIVTATVSGKVTDQNGNAIQGATVKAGTNSVVTDVDGKFNIASASFAEKASIVKVEKAGYFAGSRTFFSKEGQKYYVEIQLLTKNIAGSINASIGGVVNLSNGAEITLPSNGIIIQNTGVSYAGVVKIAMAWLDPTSFDLFKQMPGDLRGLDERGVEYGLVSYGMVCVELEGAGGEKLQIASGKKASLKFPLPSTSQSSAPATIPLWSFNETNGLWKQEGMANKNGNFYLAEVSHFSWWNCDVPLPTVSFSATFKDQSGQPLKNATVKITRNVNNTFGWQEITDSSGFLVGRLPQNESLLLQVYVGQGCQILSYSQNIGPFSSPANLGVITVNAPSTNSFTLSGMATNCSGSPITDGYIQVVTLQGGDTYRSLMTNGVFSLNFAHCNPSPTIDYFIADNNSNQQSIPIHINATPGISNIGTVAACGLSMQRFITFTLDGTTYNLFSPQDSTKASSQWPSHFFRGTNSSGTNSINFYFVGNSIGIGSYQLGPVKITVPGFNGTLTLSPQSPTVFVGNLTEFGGIGGYLAGNFNGSFISGSTNHSLQCSFRVRSEHP
jgi:hypothetical protein